MPSTKVYAELFPAGTVVAASTTKASPIVSSVINTGVGYGGELVASITNSGALGAGCIVMFQTSPDGSKWYDYDQITSSDLSSGTVTTGPSVRLDTGPMRVRAIAYGNTTNACTVEAGLQHVTGL